MLSQSDIKQIQDIFRPVREDVSGLKKGLTQTQGDVKDIKKDVAQTRKDVKVIISYFDREYVELRKRIERIEEFLKLTPQN